MKYAFDIADLIVKHLNGNLSEEEGRALREWLDQDIQNQMLLSELENKDKIEADLNFLHSVDTPAAWEKVNSQIETPERHHEFWWANRFVKYAAAIVLLGVFTYTYYHKSNRTKPLVAHIKKAEVPKNDALPGGDKATLTLGDGSVVVLEDLNNGILQKDNGLKISKKDGQLIYEISGDNGSGTITYNTISTPTGGQYHIILPDGSKVWLNSASSLHFPTVFSGKERRVTLTGEGYFEISKNKDFPFVVDAGKTNVEVLGTHFNLMAYNNEALSKTTLLEGSVKVGNGNSHKILDPGQQALVGEKVLVRTADTDEAIAWKEGYFRFENEDLKTIMRQLKRWYDVDVVDGQQIPDKHFTAMISRNTTLSKVLKMLEISGDLQFKIEDRKITIEEK